ncbi:MAG: TRAP transporter small permease [Pontibacterium sp.]
MTKIDAFLGLKNRLFQLICKLCLALAGISMVVLVLSFAWLVYGRYVVNDTPTWVEQLSLLLVVNITFLAAAVGVHERTHLAVDILPTTLLPKIRVSLEMMLDVILVGFGVAMAISAWGLIDVSMRRNIPLLGIPEGIRYMPMFACGVLMALFSAGRIPEHLWVLATGVAPTAAPQSESQEA